MQLQCCWVYRRSLLLVVTRFRTESVKHKLSEPVFFVLAMVAYGGGWREVKIQLHTFFTSALDGDECLTLSPSRFTHGKEPWHPFNRRLGGPQSRSGSFEKKRKFLSLTRSLKCTGTYELLVYAGDVNILGGSDVV